MEKVKQTEEKKLTFEDFKNLLIFLNRVQYNGLQETTAVNKILQILEVPFKDEIENQKKKGVM